MFLLTFAVVFAVLSTRVFKNQKKFTSVIIAISIALLSTWYLSYEGFDMHVLTYNAFALFFTAGIILAIIVYFIHKIDLLPGFRRALILVYGLVLFITLQQQSSIMTCMRMRGNGVRSKIRQRIAGRAIRRPSGPLIRHMQTWLTD